jgi:hypothetical protein
MACENPLLASLVSVTTLVASAVAVMVAPPAAAVQVPAMATLTVAPTATEAVLPLRVVPPTVTRVTDVTPEAVVPRLFTATLKLTLAPAAGLGGLAVMLRTCRSGPGAWATTIGVAAVNVLLLSLCSMTVLVGSTVAETL